MATPFQSRGGRIHRAGRDLPGSNWHFYPFDPDGHINEHYYGIEQIGWDGLSKPHAIHAIKYREPPALPHISEQAELLRARGERIDLGVGYRDGDCDGESFDVGRALSQTAVRHGGRFRHVIDRDVFSISGGHAR